jgi:inorganic pyrophosphatase
VAKVRKITPDPTRLKLYDKKRDIFQAIIETPKNSRNKYAYDPEQGVYTLRKILPAGMSFPYDFGFLPRTIGGDGDPLDVLVLMDEPAFPGCLLCVRIIGVIQGEQTEDGETNRNDRILAVAQATHTYANIKKISDLPRHFLKELETFFVNYHQLEGKTFKLLGCKGEQAAFTLLKQAEKKAAKRS